MAETEQGMAGKSRREVIGPVLDVEFPEGQLPAIHNAVDIKDEGKETGVADRRHRGGRAAPRREPRRAASR